MRWADTSGVEAVHSRLRYQQLANNTRITNPAKFGSVIHKTKLRKSLVYFAGKNLGKVADSDSEDEDLPDEFGEAAPEAGDQGAAAAGDLLLGEGDAGGQVAGGVETGADDGTSDSITTPKTTGKKYRKRQEILEENNLLKNEISELRRKYEEEIEEKNKIIAEKEKLINELTNNQ